MNTNLDDILYSEEPAGLITPIELKQSDIRGIEIIPLCLLGIFNPMGPTLVALNLIIKDDAPSGAILYTSLNPFAQSRLITARAPSDPGSLFELFENLYQAGDENILGALPDFVIPSLDNEDFEESLGSMLFGLVLTTPLRDSLAKTNQDYRKHWRDAWSRIPSMEEMMRQAISGRDKAPVIHEPDPEDFNEWLSIVTDMDHITAELGVIGFPYLEGVA